MDTIKGFAAAPYTLNEYGYCWANPMVLVDRNGRLPEWLENIGENVKEGWDALCDFAVDVWENHIYGVDTILYEEKIGGITYAIKEHSGGNIIVITQKDADDKNTGSIPQFVGWSVNAGIDIPKTNISINQSISGNSWNLSTWKYTNSTRVTDEQTNNYTEISYGFNDNGIYLRGKIGGSSDIPKIPEDIVIPSDSNISWSLTAEQNWLKWEEVLELAYSMVFVTATVAIMAILVLDDGVGGLADDVFLAPLGAFVLERWEYILQLFNSFFSAWALCPS